MAKGQNISQIGPVQVSWHTGQLTTNSNAKSPALPSKDVKDEKATGGELAPSSHEDEGPRSPHPDEEVVASGWGGDGDEDGMGML